jgi:hypothetical protein
MPRRLGALVRGAKLNRLRALPRDPHEVQAEIERGRPGLRTTADEAVVMPIRPDLDLDGTRVFSLSQPVLPGEPERHGISRTDQGQGHRPEHGRFARSVVTDDDVPPSPWLRRRKLPVKRVNGADIPDLNLAEMHGFPQSSRRSRPRCGYHDRAVRQRQDVRAGPRRGPGEPKIGGETSRSCPPPLRPCLCPVLADASASERLSRDLLRPPGRPP